MDTDCSSTAGSTLPLQFVMDANRGPVALVTFIFSLVMDADRTALALATEMLLLVMFAFLPLTGLSGWLLLRLLHGVHKALSKDIDRLPRVRVWLHLRHVQGCVYTEAGRFVFLLQYSRHTHTNAAVLYY
jgi:hypothetical protein